MNILQESETYGVGIESISSVLTTLDVIECAEELHYNEAFLKENSLDKNHFLLGALYTQEGQGIASLLNQLNTFANCCPYNSLGIKQDYTKYPSVIHVSANLDWALIFGNSNWPLWIQEIFAAYVSLIKQVSNHKSVYLNVNTVEAMEAWLDQGILMDYNQDLFLGNIDMSLVQQDVQRFQQQPYGFPFDSVKELPVFFQVAQVEEDQMSLIPITNLGSIVIPAMFTIKKKDLIEQVVSGTLSLWSRINNPHMESVLREFTKFTNQQHTGV